MLLWDMNNSGGDVTMGHEQQGGVTMGHEQQWGVCYYGT